MEANPDKCHFLSSLDMNTKISVSSFDIKNTYSQKVLNFHDHVSNLCKKASSNAAPKMKLSVKDFFNKCDQIRRKLWVWSHLPKKFLMENFILCAVKNKCHG